VHFLAQCLRGQKMRTAWRAGVPWLTACAEELP
jgi:hypothetical protein